VLGIKMKEKINNKDMSTLLINKKLQQYIKIHCATNNIKIQDYIADLIIKDLNINDKDVTNE
jgi:hypothetical protein